MWVVCMLLCLLLSVGSFAQIQPDFSADELLYDALDDTFDEENINLDDDFFDDYNRMFKINYLSDNEILSIRFLSVFQKYAIINYRKEWGSVCSVNELLLIDGFSEEAIGKFKHLLDFSIYEKPRRYKFSDFFKYADFDFLLRVSANNAKLEEYATDDLAKKYLGDRHKLLFKFKYNLDEKLSMGLVLEKDAGEQLFMSIDDGFRIEHLSGYILWNSKLVSVLVGDYYAQFGQGLSMWNSLFFDGGIEAASMLRTQKSIKPKTGGDEVNYLRGLAVNLKLENLDVVMYVSTRAKDATLNYDETFDSWSFSGFSSSGYHRTFNELGKINAVGERFFGANAKLSLHKSILSANFNYVKYSVPYKPKQNFENICKYSGMDNISYSLSYLSVFDVSYMYGELSLNRDLNPALLMGWYVHANSFFNIDFLFRFIHDNYHAASFLNSYDSDNETSVSVRVALFPSKALSANASVEVMKNNWVTSNKPTVFPASSCKLRVKYVFSSSFFGYVDYSFEDKLSKLNVESLKLPKYALSNRHKYRLHLEYSPLDFLTLRSRLDYLFTDDESGCLVYHDVAFRFDKLFTVITRLTCFDTDSYSSRLYSYENDVLYNFSSPAYYGQGCSVFFLVNCKINRHLSVWAKLWFVKTFDRITDKLNATVQLRLSL